MNEKMKNQVAEMKKQTIGVECIRDRESSAADQREALRHQLAEAEALVAALKAKLYDLTVAE